MVAIVEKLVEWKNIKGNRRTRRKSAPVPLGAPQIAHHLTLDQTRTPAVGSRQLTAWAVARPAV
jgi:hypothetical protein